MCLYTRNFSLEKDPETGEFYGIGYKALVDDNGLLSGTDHLDTFSLTEWLKAEGVKEAIYTDKEDGAYYPGFHLFLCPEDALAYQEDCVVGKFKYRKVLAFGKNYTYDDYKECVVAEEMKFVELVS